MFAVCSRQELVRAIPGNDLRAAHLPALGDHRSAMPTQIHAPDRRDNFFLKIGMLGIIVRRAHSGRVGGAAAFSRCETSFTQRNGFNALKRLEAAKRAGSPCYTDQGLAQAETKSAVSLGLRFVSPRLRLASLRFAMGAPRRRPFSTRAPWARYRRCRSTSCRRAPGGSRAGLRACQGRSTPACASSSWRRRGSGGPRAHARRGFRCG